MCTFTRMVTKTLTIKEEAYDRLRALKREGESFSDVVLRLTENQGDLLSGFGALGDVEGEAFAEAVADGREEIDDDFEDLDALH